MSDRDYRPEGMTPARFMVELVRALAITGIERVRRWLRFPPGGGWGAA